MRLSELPGVEVQDVAASLYIHYALAARWTLGHAAAELRRYAIQNGFCVFRSQEVL